jgi:hypothetical protein
MKMEQITLDWQKPFKLTEPTPREEYGLIGLYAVEFNSKIVYIGKAEDQGALTEARSHTHYERRLKEVGIEWDEARALVYIGTVSQDQNSARIDDAESLLIYKIKPPCNRKKRKSYRGVMPFQVINDGHRPRELPPQIQYP